MERRHVSVLANIIPALIFAVPSAIMAANDWIIPLLFYNFVIILSLISGFSNRLYITEIDNTAWKRFYALFCIKKLTKKNINPNPK